MSESQKYGFKNFEIFNFILFNEIYFVGYFDNFFKIRYLKLHNRLSRYLSLIISNYSHMSEF